MEIPTPSNEAYWQRSVRLAEHHKALGHIRVYLRMSEEPFPWQYVTEFSVDTAMRIDFKAEHPCGLLFEWGVEFANNSNRSLPDKKKLKAIIAKLPASINRTLFIKALDVCIGHLIQQSDVHHSAFRRYFDAVTMLHNVQDELEREVL